MRGLVLFLVLFSFIDAKVLEVKQLFNKKIVKVVKKEVGITKKLYASTKIDESRVYDLTLRFSGFVEKLYANKSFLEVKKGDELFSIYSDAISNIYEELKISKNPIIKKSLQKKLKLLGVNSQIKDDYTVSVFSPYNGYIIEKKINQGSFLKSGQVALKIADFSTIWVIAKAYQSDIGKFKVGDEVVVKVDSVGRFKAKIDYIYPTLNPKTKTFDVRVVLQNKNKRVIPNLFATVFVLTKKKTMLTLPKSAVLTKGEKRYVFVPLKNGEFEPKEVKARRIDSKTYEILSGVKEGDRVIDDALFMLDSDAITNALYDNDDDEDW